MLHNLTVNQNKGRDMELLTLVKLHKAVLERNQAGLQGYTTHVLQAKAPPEKGPVHLQQLSYTMGLLVCTTTRTLKTSLLLCALFWEAERFLCIKVPFMFSNEVSATSF